LPHAPDLVFQRHPVFDCILRRNILAFDAGKPTTAAQFKQKLLIQMKFTMLELWQ
jgi:hypothetical protein